MARINVRYDDRKTRKWIKDVPARMRRNMAQEVPKQARAVMAIAYLLAPHRRGLTREGIMLGRHDSGKHVERARIVWKELDRARQKRFDSSRWNGRFVEWMHESPRAKSFPWKTGRPDFFDAAVLIAARHVLNGIETGIDRALR